jgi:hypothetical protein
VVRRARCDCRAGLPRHVGMSPSLRALLFRRRPRDPLDRRAPCFAGRWSLVTGLLIRGDLTSHCTPSTAPCPRVSLSTRSRVDIPPCWRRLTAPTSLRSVLGTAVVHTHVRESSILSTATRRSLLLRNAGSR